jgi:hypothetical protein
LIFLPERHFGVSLSGFTGDFNLRLGAVGLFDLLAFLDELELLFEVRVGEQEGLEETLAPDELAGGINDEGLGSVEDGDVLDVLHGLGHDLAGIVSDEGDLEAEDLLGDGVAAGTVGDLVEELLNLFAFRIVGNSDELNFLVLFSEDGEFFVDDEATLVEGVEEVSNSDDTVGLEFFTLATNEVEGRNSGEVLSEENFIFEGLAVGFFSHFFFF